MVSIRVWTTFWCWTAYIFALVLLTRFHYITYSFTSMTLIKLKLFFRHQLSFNFIWIIQSITWYISISFLTHTWLINFFFTSLTWPSMASYFALVLSTRQESVTRVVANRDGICACFPLLTNQRFNSITSTWAIFHPFWLHRARFTRSLMASLLALMFSTIKKFIADLTTLLFLFSTINSICCFTAKTRLLDLDLTWLAWSLMTLLLAFVH